MVQRVPSRGFTHQHHIFLDLCHCLANVAFEHHLSFQTRARLIYELADICNKIDTDTDLSGSCQRQKNGLHIQTKILKIQSIHMHK